MARKLYKFINTPHVFVADMLRKKLRLHPLSRVFAGRYKTQRRYTVVSAVYQVEKYLDDYMMSLLNQTMSFESHIDLVLVDDGSTDGSHDAALRWQEKYPKNITIIRQQNGGAAAARNAGLSAIAGDWVTFIDPDDILDTRYFEAIDRFIDKNTSRNIGFIGSNLLFYFEADDAVRNTHALKFKFKDGDRVFPLDEMHEYIHLSVATGFFKSDLLKKSGVTFDSRIKPSFEDAHFIGKYLLSAGDIDVGYVAHAFYYYRKRQDKTSALDTSWQKPARFDALMRYGVLDLLQSAKAGRPASPDWAQNMALYHIMWDVKHIVNHPERLSMLTDVQQREYLSLLRQCFGLIDHETIMSFHLAGCDVLYKTALLGFFKGESFPEKRIYIDEYDSRRNLLKLRHFYHDAAPEEKITSNGKEIQPLFEKTRRYDFMNADFVFERILWVPFNPEDEVEAALDGGKVTFHCKGFVLKAAVMRHIVHALYFAISKCPREIKFLRKWAQLSFFQDKYKEIWLFIDRDVAADDNAEHLYRAVKEDRSINKAFILRRQSKDWKRLEKEGFRLIPFGGLRHMIALLHAKYLISSHADAYITSFLPLKYFGDIMRFKYIFLQHGVTQGDLSSWLNGKFISLFVTATPDETASLIEECGKYKFTAKEVAMTGFPRHDRLLQMADKKEKLVIIMPTWRKSLVGEAVGKTSVRNVNLQFYDSPYAQAWKSFLHAPELKTLSEECGYRFLFAPHQNILPYLDWFDLPDWVESYDDAKAASMQELFCRAAIMVTDYSSVAFEMGFLQRPVIYYQFDHDEFFGGLHTTQQGYFDFYRDGFGPVCEKEAEALKALAALVRADGAVEEPYKERMETTFPYRDGRSCQRVIDIIRNL